MRPIHSEEELETLAILRKEREPPRPKHDNPSDYNITQADADKMRLRYLYQLRREYREQALIFHRFSVDPNIRKDQMWFIIWQFNYWSVKVNEIEKKIKWVLSREKNKKDLKSFDLEALKAIPIENFVDVYPNNNSFKLRDERTPSCHLYRTQNRWHDFGTGEGGSVIDLIMILNDCTFIEACKYLSNVN